MDAQVQQELAQLERRCRTLTGAVLAVVAFIATYALMLFEGQTDRPSFHFYPMILAALFYLAGDILAFVWFKLITLQLAAMLAAKERRTQQAAPFIDAETGEEIEVIRPDAAGG